MNIEDPEFRRIYESYVLENFDFLSNSAKKFAQQLAVGT